MKKVDEFYFERGNPRMNIVWLSNLILKRLKLDRDYYINIEGLKGCLSEDSEIITDKGKIKIKDLKNKINKLLVYDFKNNKTLFSESVLIDSGKQEIFEIETIDGKTIQATKNHTFFIMRNNKIEEIKLKNLNEGDELIWVNNNFKIWKTYKVLGTAQIKSIKRIGIKQTYDFKVPVYNNLILGNNILTHNSGKSNFILLLALIQTRYSGIYRNNKTGHIVKVLPRLKPMQEHFEQLTCGFNFKNNMSFLDESEDVKNKFNGLDKYHPMIIDEGSKNLHKYQWNNKLQFLLVRMSDTERWQNKSVYVCFPNFKELNPAFRNDRILMRIYLYDRKIKEGYAACILSLRDQNRYISDPWHNDENAKQYEYCLRKKSISARTPYDILNAEKRLKNYAGNFEVPSLELLAPRIWDIYMKYKSYYANKDASGINLREDEESVKVNKLQNNIRKLLDYVKMNFPNLTNKDMQKLAGLSAPAYIKLIHATDKENLEKAGRY